MPPSDKLKQTIIEGIEGFGESSFDTLALLIGADKIEDESKADDTLIEILPKTVVKWHTFGDSERREVAILLYKRLYPGGKGEDPIPPSRLSEILSSVSKACNRIAGAARLLREDRQEPTEGDIRNLILKLKGENISILNADVLAEAFPGLLDSPTEEP